MILQCHEIYSSVIVLGQTLYTLHKRDQSHGSSPLNFRGDLKISHQNNWGELNFLGGPMNPNDVVVVVLKNIILC